MGKTKKLKVIWGMLGIIYFPVYTSSWLLHKIARLILAISYFGMLEMQVGKDIVSNLFSWHGRH